MTLEPGYFILAILAIVVVTGVVKIVPQGRVLTVERFGRFHRILKPGLGLLIPFFETVGRRVNMMEQSLPIGPVTLTTRDGLQVRAVPLALIQITDPVKAAYAVDNIGATLSELIQAELRILASSLTLAELQWRDGGIDQGLLPGIAEAAGRWGVQVTRLALKDLEPPPVSVGAAPHPR